MLPFLGSTSQKASLPKHDTRHSSLAHSLEEKFCKNVRRKGTKTYDQAKPRSHTALPTILPRAQCQFCLTSQRRKPAGRTSVWKMRLSVNPFLWLWAVPDHHQTAGEREYRAKCSCLYREGQLYWSASKPRSHSLMRVLHSFERLKGQVTNRRGSSQSHSISGWSKDPEGWTHSGSEGTTNGQGTQSFLPQGWTKCLMGSSRESLNKVCYCGSLKECREQKDETSGVEILPLNTEYIHCLCY